MRWTRAARCLLAGLLLGACHATVVGKKIYVPSALLQCDSDADCAIRNHDDVCCEPCPVDPYAISLRSGGVLFTCEHGCTEEDCDVPGIARPADFVAVCADHVCVRRPKR